MPGAVPRGNPIRRARRSWRWSCEVEPETAILMPPVPLLLIDGFAFTVGNRPARASFYGARAAMKFWKNCAMFWLSMLMLLFERVEFRLVENLPTICLRVGRPCGLAGCHAPGSAPLYADGRASLNAGGGGTAGGFSYFGPTMQPASRHEIRNQRQVIFHATASAVARA